MIRIVRWLLGSKAGDLHAEQQAAVDDVETSREMRAHAERLGPELRQRLAITDPFGEGMKYALHPKGWEPR